MNRLLAILNRPGALKSLSLKASAAYLAVRLVEQLQAMALETARAEVAAEAAYLAAAEVHLANHPAVVIEHEPTTPAEAAAVRVTLDADRVEL